MRFETAIFRNRIYVLDIRRGSEALQSLAHCWAMYDSHFYPVKKKFFGKSFRPKKCPNFSDFSPFLRTPQLSRSLIDPNPPRPSAIVSGSQHLPERRRELPRRRGTDAPHRLWIGVLRAAKGEGGVWVNPGGGDRRYSG